MKKLILLFTVSIIIVSCKNEPKIDYALFSGTITNPVGEEITVSGTDFNQKITVNKEGVFADTLKITPGY